jgi:hypothetical protein
MVAFAIQQSCTTDERCTASICPSRCHAPERIVVLSAVPIVALGVTFAVYQRVSRGRFVVVMLLVVVVASMSMVLAAT